MGTPYTTIVPFSTLPSCATLCGHLYDANGACVPTASTTSNTVLYGSCFCANTLVAPFSTGTAGVCDDACTAATATGGLESIHDWFSSFCSVNAKEVAATATTTNTGTTTTATSGSSTTTKSSSSSGSNSWIAGHWQWVIFIVVMVVGITAIWVGAAVWHSRYLRKKDRQYALGNIRASAASGATGLNPYPSQPHDHEHDSDIPQEAGVFAPGPESAFEHEKRRSNFLGRRRN